MLLKKKYKYLFVVSEYGSTNIILGLIKKYKIKKYNFYNIDKKINHKYIKKEISKNIFDKKFDLIVVGGSFLKKKNYELISKFKKKKIKTAMIIDHWVGIEKKIDLKYIKKFPDYFWITDYPFISKLKKKFKFNKFIQINDFYEELTVKKISSVKNNTANSVCFIDDPCSFAVKGKLLRELSIKNFFNLLRAKRAYHLNILVRPHPSMDSSFKNIYANFKDFKINFSKKNNPVEKDIKKTKFIVGMQSKLLKIIRKAKYKTYTCLPLSYNKFNILNFENIKNLSLN